LKAPLASAPLKLAFDGSIANEPARLMEGTLTVDEPVPDATPCAGSVRRRRQRRVRPLRAEGARNVVGPSIALTKRQTSNSTWGNVAEA